MQWVRVYWYGYYVITIPCEFYEPYSDVDKVCKYCATDTAHLCKNKELLLQLFKRRERVQCYGWKNFDTTVP